MSTPTRTETCILRFDSPGFEGRLAGALERAESGGALQVVEALFVGRDAEDHQPLVLHLRGGGGALAGAITDFRLDPTRRRAMSARTLAEHPDAPALRRLAASLPPGGAAIAIVLRHAWADALADAVRRTGGTVVVDEIADTPPERSLGERTFSAVLAAPAPDC